MFDNLTRASYNRSFYLYLGSVTEPPCTEGVYRAIMKTPIKLPAVVIDKIKSKTFNSAVE